MIKIGLIGTGFMGKMHAACYEALAGKANFQVTAVADDNADNAAKIAEKFGAKVYSSGEQLIREADVNTIDICLPTFLHTKHALQALERGHDVFIEKPVCLEEEEAAQLLEAKAKSSGKVMVGHCIRFWPEYEYLKKLKDEGTYGAMISGVFKRVSPRPTWGWNDWLLDGKRSGSAALDLHIHDVDYVRYLLGEPDSTTSMAVNNGGYADHIFSTYKYGKTVVSLEGSWGYPEGFPFEMSYRVKFEQATVTFTSSGLDVYTEAGEHLRPELAGDAPEDGASSDVGGNVSSLGGYYNELLYFLRCLEENKEITVSPLEEGIASFRLARREIAAGIRE
ncbi:Gfo/Idh/MocA family oxidoreductase [Cohnella sp. LGH]|uniref:Gfo/Idh/MocA family protein n=1 Tax=Cohnella sp. LGH TaxID=1619153 RepID=UPI001ADCECE7|nr:Gfo/Idh/MocA family oxidoreductase [Cohnella sp. LGH]QTH40122.1 Gfo/Idh/MocA family oxidoreductase [Cohnella sp. LGH]